MPRNRTNILVTKPTGAEPKESKKSTSMFMVTLNPNIRYDSLETPRAKEMIQRLEALSNFLLKKKNILASLTFKSRPPKAGELPIVLSREQHLSKIVSISEDRTGAVEWGDKMKRLHVHIEFIIEHRTFIHLNKEFYLEMASVFTGIDKSKIHCNLRGATRAEGYKKYTQKNATDSTPHFFDQSASLFIQE
jgi:hypothetical protein